MCFLAFDGHCHMYRAGRGLERQAARVLHWGKARPCRPSKRGRAAGRKARRQLITAGESPKVASRLRSDRVAIAELRALERMDAAWPEGEEHMAKLSVNAMIGLWARSTEVVCSVRISSPAQCCGLRLRRSTRIRELSEEHEVLRRWCKALGRSTGPAPGRLGARDFFEAAEGEAGS